MHAIEMISEFDIKTHLCARILLFSLHEILLLISQHELIHIHMYFYIKYFFG